MSTLIEALTKDEYDKIERIKRSLEDKAYISSYEDSVLFLLCIVDKLLKRLEPKYTESEIVDMHKHL